MTARKQRAGNQNPDLGNQFAPGKQFYDVGEARRGEHDSGRTAERKREREGARRGDETRRETFISLPLRRVLSKKHETKEKC